MRQHDHTVDPQPGLLSILTAVWDGSPVRHLRTLAESVLHQHGACEWVILDNGCRHARLVSYLRDLSRDARVNLLHAKTNLGITSGLRMCLEHASGQYVLPVDADDVLYPDALKVIATRIVALGYPALLYTDEDKVMGRGVYQPFFKPDWDPVLLLNSAYIAHLGILDRRRALELGVYNDPKVEGSPDWDAFVRFLIADHTAIHIPEVMYSWRVHAQSTADDVASKPYIHSSQKAVLQRYLDAHPHGSKFDVALSPLFGGGAHWRFVRRHGDAQRMVTVTIRDASENARNLAIAARGAPFVHLVGPDVQIDDPDWTWEALGLFELYPDAVMIGGRIRNEQGFINDAGRYFGLHGVWGCPYRGLPVSDPGYFGQVWKQRSVSAVSTQFAVVRSEFLLPLLNAVPEQASVGFLGAWAGAHALRTRKRVVYSPFLSGISDVDWDSFIDTAEMACFESANRDIVPDRRFYSPHLSLRKPFQLEQ